MNTSDMPSGLRLALAGWAGLLLFAIVVAVSRGSNELAFAAVSGAVAVGLGVWIWRRPSRAASVTSLVVGALEALEQAGYTVADVSDHGGLGVAAADLLGLVSALAVVAGSWQLLARRRATA